MSYNGEEISDQEWDAADRDQFGVEAEEPAPASSEEDAIQASEVKRAMSYNGRAVCDWKGARDTLAAEIRALRSQLARKDEGRTISWQLINDIIDETLEEEAAPLECALQMILSAHGYTAVNEPASPEPAAPPRRIEVTTPNEADKVLEMRIRSMSYASDIQNAIAAYREGIETKIKTRHQEYEKSVDLRWSAAIAKHEAEVTALRFQLARKDEGMRKALEEAAQSLEALAGLAGKDETMLEYDQVRGYALNRAMAARAALREPDGRKGE